MHVIANCGDAKADHPTQSGTSQTPCGNAVENVLAAIAKLPIPPTAKYIGTIMVTLRLIDSKSLSEFTGIPLRTVQRAMTQVSASGVVGAMSATSGAPLAPSAPPVAPEQAPRVHARAQMESPSEINIPREVVEDSPLSPQFNIDEETCEQFHEICVTWGRKPGSIEFGQPTIEDTNKQLAGEIKAVAILHPEAGPRMLHAALLAALNTTSAKAKDPQEGQFKGRGRSSASSYLRKAYSSEVARMIRDAANAEAHRRTDHQFHTASLQRRVSGAPARSSRPNLATMEFPA